MFGRKQKPQQPPSGRVDGGAGRGIPLGGHDNRPPTGYRNNNDYDELAFGLDDEDVDPADRRKDPLRR